MLFTSQLELNVLYTRDTVHFLPSNLPSIFQWSRSEIVVHVINSWLAVLQFVSSHTGTRNTRIDYLILYYCIVLT